MTVRQLAEWLALHAVTLATELRTGTTVKEFRLSLNEDGTFMESMILLDVAKEEPR